MGQVIVMISLFCFLIFLSLVAPEDADNSTSPNPDTNSKHIVLDVDLTVNRNSDHQNNPGSQNVETSGLNPILITTIVELIKTNLNAEIYRIETSRNTTLTKLTEIEMILEESKARMDRAAAAMFEISSIYKGRRYYLSKRGVDSQIHTAEGLCEMFGGYLVELDNQDEYMFVQYFIQSKPGFLSWVKFVYIGGTDQVNEGDFVYQHSNRSFTDFYVKWGPEATTNDDVEGDCIALYKDSGWKMIDNPCYNEGRKFRFVCEVPLP